MVQFAETNLLEAVKLQVVLGSCLQDGKLSGRRPKYPIAPPSNSNCTPRFGGGAFVSPRQFPGRQLSTAKSELLLISFDGQLPVLDQHHPISALVERLSTISWPRTPPKWGQALQDVCNDLPQHTLPSNIMAGSKSPCMTSFEVCETTRETRRSTSRTV